MNWDKTRFDDISSQIRPFLSQSGFHPSKVQFVPVAAMDGINLVSATDAPGLRSWYKGATLLDCLGMPDDFFLRLFLTNMKIN